MIRDSVLLVTFDFPPEPGGVQSYLYNLVRWNPKGKWWVLSPKMEGALEFDQLAGLNTKRIRHSRHPMLRKIWWLYWIAVIAGIVVKQRIGLVQFSHTLPIGLGGLLVKFILKRPFVVYAYAMDIIGPQRSPWQRPLLKLVLRNASKIISISEFTRKHILQLGIPSDKVEVVPPGVDIEMFRPGDVNGCLLETLGLDQKKVVLSVSRLVKRKGQDILIRAFKKVVENCPQAVLLLGGEGPEKPALESLAESLELSSHVRLLGYIQPEDLPIYYRLCDVFVMTSRQIESGGSVEGFGIVYLEANACGKPVVAGRSGGTSEAVLDGITGILVDPEDEEQIADALIHLLQNKEQAQRLGTQGRQRVLEQFTWDKIAARVEQILNEVMSETD